MTTDRLKDLMELTVRAEKIQLEMEQLKGKLELLKDHLEMMRDYEQEGMDDLPDSDKYWELQETMEKNVDLLEDAVSNLEDMLDEMDMDEVLESLNEVKDNTLECDLNEDDVDEDDDEDEDDDWMMDDEDDEDEDDDRRRSSRSDSGGGGSRRSLFGSVMDDYNDGYRRGRMDAVFGDRYDYIHGVKGSDSYRNGYVTGFEHNDTHGED